jgi:hypothetical protein
VKQPVSGASKALGDGRLVLSRPQGG